MHASWQQEVFAAVERSAKYFRDYLGGLVEVINPGADDFIIASGCAVSQAREAVRQEGEQGRTVGLVKVKTIRPFPVEEILDAVKDAKRILIPEFNQAGWLHKEVCSVLYGRCDAVIKDGPRVFGGMTMPTEMILEWLEEFRKEVK
jgi:pyruvate ferredoxin oxidoreductase alpha subunit